MRLRQLALLGLYVVLAGCGCDSDGFSPDIDPQFESSAFAPGSTLPPCLVENDETPGRKQIDVLFVLDDGWTMENVALGLIPQNLFTDARLRTQAAQAIMRHLQQTLLPALEARFPGDEFDIAYGVGRYEDFGGTFATTGRNFPQDAQARPWILQMPILRQGHPRFAASLAQAIARTTPGDGRRIQLNVPVSDDPNSGIEALWQAATGTGLDADGVAGTLGSGAPCALLTQTTPGVTGDVPAVTFAAVPDETDPDGRPVFFVRDENGVVTIVDNPANPGELVPCIASGDLGGVGWRRNASRFIVLAGDIATVAHFPAAVPATVTSTAGTTPSPVLPTTGPRQARAVTAQAFNNDSPRFGTESVTIAPNGAADVPATISALNGLHIEVFCLASPFIVSNQAKPNGGSDVDGPTHVDDISPGNLVGQLGDPTITPWTWMSAVSILTGSEILFPDETLTPRLLPAVYNLATVWPIDPAATPVTPDTGLNEGLITDHLLEDVMQRLAGPPDATSWISGDFLQDEGGSGFTAGPLDLPIVTVPVTYTPNPGPGFAANISALPALVPQVLNVNVPVYLPTQPTPAGANTAFAFTTLGAAFADPTNGVVISETLPYTIVADFGAAIFASQPGANLDVYNALETQLREKFALLGAAELTNASLLIRLENIIGTNTETIVDEITVQTVLNGCGYVDVVGQGVLPVGTQPCDPLGP